MTTSQLPVKISARLSIKWFLTLFVLELRIEQGCLELHWQASFTFGFGFELRSSARLKDALALMPAIQIFETWPAIIRRHGRVTRFKCALFNWENIKC